MTTGAHDAGGGFGRSAGANVARGVMVIVGAVIVGLLLMNRGLTDNRASASSTNDATATTPTTTAEEAAPASSTTTTEAPGTTTTLGAPRDPSEVAVLVINGTENLKGVAGRGTDALKTSNYITRDPKNADTNGPSVILYTEGYQAEANAIAAIYGIDADVYVQPFDAASSPIADTQEANIVVRIGNDGVIQV